MLVFPSCQEVLWKKDRSFRVVAFISYSDSESNKRINSLCGEIWTLNLFRALGLESNVYTNSTTHRYQAVLKVA